MIEMKAAGVDMQYLIKLEGVKTGNLRLKTLKKLACGFVTISETGQNSIIIVGGANMHYDDLTTIPKQYIDGINQSNLFLNILHLR